MPTLQWLYFDHIIRCIIVITEIKTEYCITTSILKRYTSIFCVARKIQIYRIKYVKIILNILQSKLTNWWKWQMLKIWWNSILLGDSAAHFVWRSLSYWIWVRLFHVNFCVLIPNWTWSQSTVRYFKLSDSRIM